MKKVTVITTLRHNVGDDFVREGILHLLGQVLGRMQLRLIHKHLPITARGELAWIHGTGIDHQMDRLSPSLALRVTQRLDRCLPILPATDAIRSCDLLVQSGAPIYWCHKDGTCATNEWWHDLIERRWIPFLGNRKFINIAGGTCQHWGSDGSEFAKHPEVLEYIRRFHDLTVLTTLRDTLSARVLSMAERQASVLPCTSIFAVDGLGIKPQTGEFVVFNYMPGGGHYEFGQPIDAALWESRFVETFKKVSKNIRCILVCHDRKELAAARRMLPNADHFISNNYRDYLQLYARSKWGLMNRVHGAFALASLGKPAIVIGSDSRAQMASLIGLPATFVNNANIDWLSEKLDWIESVGSSFPDQMATIKHHSSQSYLDLLQSAVGQ